MIIYKEEIKHYRIILTMNDNEAAKTDDSKFISQKSSSECEVRVLGAFRNSFAYAGNANYSFFRTILDLKLFLSYLNNNATIFLII